MDDTNSESNPFEEFSTDPLTKAEGLDALMGMLGSTDEESEVEQPEDDSPLEASDDIVEEDVEEGEESEEVDETELEASEEDSVDEQTIELEDSEYDDLIAIKDWAAAVGFTDIEQLRSGVMMQSAFTQKTQEHSANVKAWTETTAQQTQELAQILEINQAILYGKAAQFDPVAMQQLKETDPMAYQEQLESYMTYTAQVKTVDEQIAKVTADHQAQQEVAKKQTVAEQTILFQQLVPDAADPVKAGQINTSISEYWTSIGGNPDLLKGITGAMELKVLYDAAKNTSVAKEVTKAKSKTPKKPGKRLLRGGSPKGTSQKKKAARQQRQQNLKASQNSFEQKAIGQDMIFDMLNGEL